MRDVTQNPAPGAGSVSAGSPAKPGAADGTVADVLDRHTTVGALWRAEGDRVRCFACGHRCLISAGRRGVCRVRFNQGGQLRVPFGYVSGVQCDPVEKKPFFHVLPGSEALTFGMLGCDFHCSYCQNWVTSQALRDEASRTPIQIVTPQQLVRAGVRAGARLVVSSYNEPLITAEWAVAVFQQAKEAGLACAFVSNGNATPEVLDFLRPWIVAYKIDLKGFDDKRYRTLGGRLELVTQGVRLVHERGLWLEVVTLVVPGFNDSEAELRQIAEFIASVNRDIPWHVTAFHGDYKMTGPPNTTAAQVMRAAEIGVEAGLRFVYAGNAPGRVGPWENTYCPNCRKKLIDRFGYTIREYKLTADGKCPACRTPIPGIWPAAGAAGPPITEGMAGGCSRWPRSVRVK
jgi:pyruvate formate lyase activating enzyme